MLELFRRYQKILYIALTAIIIFSFAFFGSYGAFTSGDTKDTVAFTAVDGSRVYRSELHDLTSLLSSAQRDLFFGIEPAWGNGFNDGVMSKDILGTGIGEIIIAPYLAALDAEFGARLEKEKRYASYVHPGAPFLSAEAVWGYFAKDIKQNLDALRLQNQGLTPEAFALRVQLFQAQERFPQGYLKQLIKYQEGDLPQDEELAFRDLSLFGYHSIEDWFGKNYVELVAKYIINCAKIAERQGYRVSHEEALQSLTANLDTSFKQNRQNPYFGDQTLHTYFQGELRRLGLDQTRLVQAWQKVLLFRKLFRENKEALLVSDLSFKDFYNKMNEYTTIELYKLPEEFIFKSNTDLQKFQIYVNAIQGKKDEKWKGDRLAFPQKKIITVEEMQKLYPQLVRKSYRLRYATVNKDQLTTKVGVRDTWEWETQEANWKMLTQKFPELCKKRADTQDEKLHLLESLSSQRRAEIDAFSRQEIVSAHPEWIEKALGDAHLKDEDTEIKEQGGVFPFAGIKNRAELLSLLDASSLQELDPKLSAYSQDGKNFHRIIVCEKQGSAEILTLKEAIEDGTLTEILQETLEAAYPKVRTQNVSQFVKENGEWKPFIEVQDLVGELYFEELYKQLDLEIEHTKKLLPNFCNWENKNTARCACRLVGLLQKAEVGVQANPQNLAAFLQDKKNPSLVNQGKLVSVTEKIIRREKPSIVDPILAFSLPQGKLSPVSYFAGTGVCFFKVVDRGVDVAGELIHNKVMQARDLIGNEIERELAAELLQEMQKGGSLGVMTPHAG